MGTARWRSSDFIEHQRGFPTADLDGLERRISGLRRSIPDINLEVADTIYDRAVR